MQPRSLLTRELSRVAAHGDAQWPSQIANQAKPRSKLDARMQPVAAELQAILRGHLGGCNDSSGLSVFGTSPPPRDCQNALVRDAGFAIMREGRSVASQGESSCASACHYTAIRDSSFTNFCDRSCHASPYFSSPVSVLSTAAA